MNIHLVPILRDNYAFVLETQDGRCAVIDPGDAPPVIAFIEERGLELIHIINTHYHWDHTDGNLEVQARFGCDIYGPERERAHIPGLSVGLAEGQDFELFGHDVQIFECPGHTRGHLVFYIPAIKAVFVGDVLFSMGCGRLFEGSAADAWQGFQKIIALPDDTMMYAGHEYTIVNAKFCMGVEPDNADLKARYDEVKALRKAREPSLPVSLGVEKKTNAFIRSGSAEAFAELRAMRDRV